MRKRIYKMVWSVCSAVMVALGFGSCTASRQAESGADLQGRVARLQQIADEEHARTSQSEEVTQDMVKESERQYEHKYMRLVYGPPPTPFKQDIDKK